MKRHMIGNNISDEALHKRMEINKANRTTNKIKTVEIKPTMQTGYNEDGTIKEEEIKPFMYELNGIKDK
ncbi:hypothetical protein [Clostridium thailandense]|uniref:Uncharacterized protein n=1 Tax=Clostridium thailandense TaxID=2794346 RepID=A0A949TZ30_9CLOT|nr:hypothetical protein [Clostridium thailandense]MBV7275288.1 hypothetical protein [Clostridium thailandense]MCH5135804.1 hypothetical protein [Clostridiaceae bacterium UIB06]